MKSNKGFTGKSESQLARQSFAEIISETISPGFGQVRLPDQFPILCLSVGSWGQGRQSPVLEHGLFIYTNCFVFFFFRFWGLACGQGNRL